MSGYYHRWPGFHPINRYLWDGRTSDGRDNTMGRSLTVRRLWMLFLHARFIPFVVRESVQTWRVNTTPGHRWRYPWQR